MSTKPLSWLGVMRLGLVQTAIGAIVVLCTAVLNRVMTVELSLAATIPGALVAFHYAVQFSRPQWGHAGDRGGRRVPWILGGMAALAAGALGASACIGLWSEMPGTALGLAILSFAVIGGGVGAAGTNVLALLAARVAPERRGPSATIVWLMMIAGIAITAGVIGSMLDPYSPQRLLEVAAMTCLAALVLATLGVIGIGEAEVAPDSAPRPAFREALRQTWGDASARSFTIFVFVSMLAYSTQDLILEPFAGFVFGYEVGQSTQLTGAQHGGVFLGLIVGGIFAGRFGSLTLWTVGGCIASALCLAGLAQGAFAGPGWPLAANVSALGFSNGIFAVAAITSMMTLAGSGDDRGEGVRMGVFGAAQALAFGLGGFMGTVLLDAARLSLETPAAFAVVFALEAALFGVAAVLALGTGAQSRRAVSMTPAE